MKLIRWYRDHYIAASLLTAMAMGAAAGLVYAIWNFQELHILSGSDFAWWLADLHFALIAIFPVALLVFYPMVITAAELILLVRPWRNGALRNQGRYFDLAAMLLGVPYTIVFMSLSDVEFTADWMETLYNAQVHTPINTHSAPTVIVLTLLGFGGYLLLTYAPLEKLPPLGIVFSISAIYLGCGVQILWAVQIANSTDFVLPLLLPACVLMLSARTIRDVICAGKALPREGTALKPLQKLLRRAALWPVLALVAAAPLMGILVAVLALFGQSPSAAIQAFTETADWNLSQRVAPQNLYYDEHYLCTVAAGGHRRVVRPQRMGVRHGHAVIVNRQLCVANAFEQILEEKTPTFHRHLRHFYDTYGFPVAKLIHSKWAADLVYFVMKPLEWLFLLVLYCTDADPESRIAIQYTGRSVHDFEAA
ncbi:MAG: hypothetical protein IJ751_02780 [Oscillospiraceae bacterium]|nr:hypothetical protein [Oscillospiraceae bacterium]